MSIKRKIFVMKQISHCYELQSKIFSAYQIYQTIRQKIQMDNFWLNPNALDQLYIAQSLCDQWILSVQLLTTQTWVKHTTEWKGEAARLDLIQAYKKRLDEISVVRRLCNQVNFQIDHKIL